MKSRPQIWLEYAAARALLGVLSVLPKRASLFASSVAALAAYRVLGGLRRVAMTNLHIAFPELSQPERECFAKGSFKNLGRILAEMSRFPTATPASLAEMVDFQIDPAVYAEYERLKGDGRGVIIVSPHLGNWELLVYAWSALEGPISYLARPLDNPMLEGLTVGLRTKFGNRPINKTNSVTPAMKVLRAAGILGILADVNAHPKEGVFVPFFGTPACTSAGVALLAIRTNAAIIPMCCVWNAAEKRYVGVHGRVIYPAITGDRKRDILDTTADFTSEVEKLVRRFPDQWLWIHKRWKTRPPGESDLYQ